MAKTKKVDRKMRKFNLDVILSVATGYMLAKTKDPQGSYIDLIEHITKEKYTNATMIMLERICELFIKAKFPETKLLDKVRLLELSATDKNAGRDEWLDECVAKGMKKTYRVKGLTDKEYGEVYRALFAGK